MNYFLLPGNPPAVHFYELWSQEIRQEQPAAKATVSVYPSVHGISNSPTAMDRILAAHAEQLQNFQQKSGGPVTLIGHSLGGYFALRLLEQNPEWVHRAYLVHPFLRAPTLRGQVILKAMRAIYPFDTLKVGLVRSRKLLERFNSDLPWVSDAELFKTFATARHEEATIAQDRSPIAIRPELRDKIRVFYTPHDTWCSAAAVVDLQRQVTAWKCSEPHGFVTQTDHRKSLFEKILQDSKQIL